MKTIINIHLTLALLVAPAFAGNDKNYTYLALGDSIPFGMDITRLPPYATHLPTANQFTGYPEIVAAAEHLLQSKKEVNASCPGETSGSFLYGAIVPDNGCNSPHILPPPASPIDPFKMLGLLHTNYTGAQMDFAEAQFDANKHIDLVTLNIGANDVLLVLLQCAGDLQCAQPLLGPALDTYENNLRLILTRIRAHYGGTLVLMTYYSPTPALDGVTMAVNGRMLQVVADLSKPGFAPIKIADGFTAFQTASANFGYDACQAGLLIPLPPPIQPGTSPCDIHPSPMGQNLLAATVELAIGASH
jgi:lysophospholipase L1-like esterase